VRAQTRHQLKEDRFSKVTLEAAERTAHWSVEHRSTLIIVALAVLVIAGGAFGAWYHFDQQDQAASVELNQAVRTMDTPLRPAGAPAQPENPSFASNKERETEAQKQFLAITEKYPHTRSADFARYFLALTTADLGDNANAENELKAIADTHNEDLAALAKFALASVYRNQRRDKEAIDLYNQLAAKPAKSVSKVMAQLELAATYKSANLPLEAKRTYELIQKENPSTPAAQAAAAKLQDLK
jgi:predicted negative regulator of RcsB-dependent stress response